ncbi:MAG: hypothetical protein BroJett013_22820 [Alphaproteobacteria bacterium]|nr:MAG: hypothetical protein BroJett013_22820 [Alphaproteobacteria bacterium]
MDADTKQLKKKLKDAGLSDRVIEAAWPAWWSTAASDSPSAQAELRFSLARRLGLSPKALVGDRVEFVWRDHVRFKNLRVDNDDERAALNSFGLSIARILFRATKAARGRLDGLSAEALRDAIIQSRPFVDLSGLLATCWGLGVPVIHLRVYPLKAKSMHAMIVRDEGRHAVLLLKDSRYPAPAAFWLAHEIGHAAKGHLKDGEAIADVFEPSKPGEEDAEETEADRFALAALTGTPDPNIVTNVDRYTATSLAAAVLTEGPRHRIEPGTLALCLAYKTSRWATANAALRHIYSSEGDVWRYVNSIAEGELDWSELSEDSADYLREVMALSNA